MDHVRLFAFNSINTCDQQFYCGGCAGIKLASVATGNQYFAAYLEMRALQSGRKFVTINVLVLAKEEKWELQPTGRLPS